VSPITFSTYGFQDLVPEPIQVLDPPSQDGSAASKRVRHGPRLDNFAVTGVGYDGVLD
jgi:hypothetical protein